ncbi:MAG: type II secretion system protein GspK [Gemmatimonadota bacterium]|nr:type II secretion system protein GspK [Gemmatimonadota bacterium]
MRQRPGVALMLAVWMVAVLGAIAAAIVSATRGSESLAMNLKAEAQARRAAESGAIMGVAALERLLADSRDSSSRRVLLNSLEKGRIGAEEQALGDERFVFTFVDVNSRLDVNWATAQQLARLFQYFTSPMEAAAAASAIRGSAGESGTSMPRSAPLRSLDALDGVPGVSRDLLMKTAPYLTVDGDGRINAASASDTVLAAAAGDVEYEPSRLLLVSRGWAKGHKLTHEIQAVYAIELNKLVLVHWRERDL